MKKRVSLLTILFFVPFLLANSPAPFHDPDQYDDYVIENTEVEIVSVQGSKRLYFRGKLTNTGSGMIDCQSSYLLYDYQQIRYRTDFYDTSHPKRHDALFAGQSLEFDVYTLYSGSSLVGIITSEGAMIPQIYGYVNEDFYTGINISAIEILTTQYRDDYNQSYITASFAWDNPGDRSTEYFYLRYEIGGNEYANMIMNYDVLTIGGSDTTQFEFTIDGNVAVEDFENMTLHFIPRDSYYDTDHYWGDFAGFFILLGIGVVFIIAPVAITTTILIVRAIQKRKAK